MMKIQFHSTIFSNYSGGLVDRIYKVLPLFEEKNEGLFSYIQSLILELHGIYWAVESIQSNGDYIILIATLESISDYALFCDSEDHAVVKREIFKCLEVVKRIKTTSESGV